MKSNCFWFLVILLTFIVTLPVTWWGMSKADFFYATLHDSIGIDEHIQRFAPKNQYKKLDFEKTSKEERVALFHGVVTAIHDDGKGLESLSYTRPNKQETPLFTKAEVTHLKDVADLLNKIKPLMIFAVIVWLIAIFWVFLKRTKLPSAKRLASLSLVWVVIAILVLLLGPEKIFNQLHIWAFPADNQWFFYYEESLMSTMMKAPFLFAYISAIWVFLSMMLTVVLFKSMHLFQNLLR